MRVVANYSTSLFDYINSDKNLKEVLSQGADESLLSEGAKKTLREKGISLNGSTTRMLLFMKQFRKQQKVYVTV